MRGHLARALVLCALLVAPARANDVDAVGFDSRSVEDWTATGSAVGSSSAARTGVSGLRLTTSGSQVVSLCKNYDTALLNLVSLSFAFRVQATTLTAGTSLKLFRVNQDSELGFWFELARDAAGNYTLSALYQGKDSLPYALGSYGPITSNVFHLVLPYWKLTEGTPDAFELRWAIYPDNVPEAGGVVVESTQELAVDCGAGGCDLREVCFGDSAAVTLGAALDFDDLFIENTTQITGRRQLHSIFPNGAGALNEWTDIGCGGGGPTYECVDDWAVGAADSCHTGGGGSYRTRNLTGIRTDLFAMTDPTIGSDETILFLREYALGCDADEGETSQFSSVRRASGGQVLYGPTVDWLGSDSTMQHYRNIVTTDGAGAGWSSSNINSAQFGYRKVNETGNGDPHVTALLVNVATEKPAPLPDLPACDQNGDGETMLVAGCDSVSAANASSYCTAAGTNGCNRACTTDEDCDGGATCQNEQCQQLCNIATDCDCATGATCPAHVFFMNQVVARLPYFQNIAICAVSATYSEWWRNRIPTLMSTTSGSGMPSQSFCRTVKGRFGKCAEDGTKACRTNADCSTTCTLFAPDYVLSGCGAGNCLAPWVPSNCENWQDVHSDIYGNQSCPRAVTGATGYACEYKSCTTHADCSLANGGPSDSSLCFPILSDLTNPPWQCRWGANAIGSCADHPTWECSASGSGLDECQTCNLHTCTATKACTCPCDSIPCDDDSDCTSAVDGVGGFCNTGAGHCEGCGRRLYNPTTPAEWGLTDRRIALTRGPYHASEIINDLLIAKAVVEGSGGKYVGFTYPATFEGYAPKDSMGQWQMRALRREVLDQFYPAIDMMHVVKMRDRRITTAAIMGTMTASDNLHPSPAGASVAAEATQGFFDNMYMVCSGNHAVPCGYQHVPCQSNGQCDPDGPGTNGADCTASVCLCSTDANCPTGTTCEEVSTGVSRCVGMEFGQYPSGVLGQQRQMRKSDKVCSDLGLGTCSVIRTFPRCTTGPLVRCTDTSDCAGGQLAGNVCSADGAWRECDNDGGCHDDGAFAASDPACVSTDPTNLPNQRLCVQVTP